MSRPMATTAKLRAMMHATRQRGNPGTYVLRVARKAYNMGRVE